jgi:hypothetical protein
VWYKKLCTMSIGARCTLCISVQWALDIGAWYKRSCTLNFGAWCTLNIGVWYKRLWAPNVGARYNKSCTLNIGALGVEEKI